MLHLNKQKQGYTPMHLKLKVFRKVCLFILGGGLFFMGFMAPINVHADELYTKSGNKRGSVTGLDIPRFVSLRSNKVFLRSGPAVRYPVNWVYNHQNYPVEVLQEFDTWRKVRDGSGTEGWVHQSLIAGRRYVQIDANEQIMAYAAADIDARVTMRLEPGAIARLISCEELWCKISANSHEGWTQKKHIWGVYASDRIN